MKNLPGACVALQRLRRGFAVASLLWATLLASMVVNAEPLLAQDVPPPRAVATRPRPVAKPVQATLVISATAACNVIVDGIDLGSLSPGAVRSQKVGLGEHIIISNCAGQVRPSVFTADEPKQYAVLIRPETSAVGGGGSSGSGGRSLVVRADRAGTVRVNGSELGPVLAGGSIFAAAQVGENLVELQSTEVPAAKTTSTVRLTEEESQKVVQLSVAPYERYWRRFEAISTETFLDRETGLVWNRPQTNASERVQAHFSCIQLETDGRKVWRLPTKWELRKLRGGSILSGDQWHSPATGPAGANEPWWVLDFDDAGNFLSIAADSSNQSAQLLYASDRGTYSKVLRPYLCLAVDGYERDRGAASSRTQSSEAQSPAEILVRWLDQRSVKSTSVIGDSSNGCSSEGTDQWSVTQQGRCGLVVKETHTSSTECFGSWQAGTRAEMPVRRRDVTSTFEYEISLAGIEDVSLGFTNVALADLSHRDKDRTVTQTYSFGPMLQFGTKMPVHSQIDRTWEFKPKDGATPPPSSTSEQGEQSWPVDMIYVSNDAGFAAGVMKAFIDGAETCRGEAGAIVP